MAPLPVRLMFRRLSAHIRLRPPLDPEPSRVMKTPARLPVYGNAVDQRFFHVLGLIVDDLAGSSG